MTGDEIYPEPSYKLQSSPTEIYKKVMQDPEYAYASAAQYITQKILKLSPELAQNIDEWVREIPLTPIVYGEYCISFEHYLTERNKHFQDQPHRRMEMGYLALRRMSDYIRDNNLVYLYC